MKMYKRAKRSEHRVQNNSLLGRERVHFVEDMDCFQNHRANNFQTLGTKLVDRVLGRVPEDIVVAVAEVDEIGTRYAAFLEGNVIISDLVGTPEEVRLISHANRGLVYHAFEPGS